MEFLKSVVEIIMDILKFGCGVSASILVRKAVFELSKNKNASDYLAIATILLCGLIILA